LLADPNSLNPIMKHILHGRSFLLLISVALLLSVCVDSQAQRRKKRHRRVPPPIEEPILEPESTEPTVEETRLKLVDGTFMRVDEAWESENGIWYKLSGITHLAGKDRVKSIERVATVKSRSVAQVAVVQETTQSQPQTPAGDGPAWIYLVGGARFEVESASESPSGVWYRRGPMSVFIERSRIDRIEREDPESLAKLNSSKERGWSTGNARIDGLIKLNAAKYGVDPYLIFCVMEQESHFNPRALSPKGARGLMQLMPGTAARFGVRKVHDPAQNIAGGTRYLKQLMTQFNGRVDLVLASYNAGEGAVMKYGNRVPPYRETRNYVKRIGYKYRRAKTPVPLASKNSVGGN
jgi:hypothetical protein